MSESYFFACIPRNLKVEHSFAKTIRPNTKYRIMVFKGVQKCDEMKEPIRSKLVGGKIDLESPELFFNIPLYNPTKSIYFTIKLFEEKPNEEQNQVASFTLMSSEYIQSYKNEKQNLFRVEAMLKDDLFVIFDLFVEKSKFSLTDALKKNGLTTSRSNIQVPQDGKSQSSSSKQVLGQRDSSVSSSKRLERKGGHKGLLRSRNDSRQNDDRSREGSVTSSPKKGDNQPLRGQRSIYSSSKISTSKVFQTEKIVQKSEISLKSGENGDNRIQTQSNSEINPRAYNYQPRDKQGSVQKSQSGRKNVVVPPFQRNIQSPRLQNGLEQNPSQSSFSLPVTPRATSQQPDQMNMTLPTSTKSSILPPYQADKQSLSSARSLKNDNFLKNNSSALEKPQRNIVTSLTSRQQKVSENESYLPLSSSKDLEDSKSTKEKNQQKTSRPNLESSSSQIKFKKTQTVGDGKVQQQKVVQKEEEQKRQLLNTKIAAKVQIANGDEKSEKTIKQIKVKSKQVKKDPNSIHESGKVKGSLRVKQLNQLKQAETIEVDKIAAEKMNKILYVIFLVVSAFLIYIVMQPTRRT